MKKLYLVLSILIMAGLPAGCAPKAVVQGQEVRALENPASTVPPISATSTPEDSAGGDVVPENPPASCPVTVPQDPSFTAPPPYSPNSPFASNFWYGSNSLWTDLPGDGIWYDLPLNSNGYTQKIFWWNESYAWNEEPQPELTVTGERLDATSPPLIVGRATNAYASDIGSAMLVGVDFPTLGCWKITGKYKGAELSFVIWVGP